MTGNPSRSLPTQRSRETGVHASRPRSWVGEENPSLTAFSDHHHPPPLLPFYMNNQKNVSTPHPALIGYENKPLPPLNDGKRKRNGIKTIGRFFRTFGKSPRPTMDSTTVSQPGATITTASTTTTITHLEPLFVPNTNVKKENNNNKAVERPIIPKETLVFGPDEEEDEDEEDCEDFDNNNQSNLFPRNNSVQTLNRHSSECNLQQARPRMRRSISVDEIKRKADMDETFEQEKHDSQIAGDRLSKRLSGNHYGSAGGLILSTLHLAADQQSEAPESIGLTAETSESDSVVAPATPPLSVTKADAEDSDNHHNDNNKDEQVHRQAMDIARRIWDQDATVYNDFEHIVEWIGDGKPQSSKILKYYFLHFDFTNVRLDDAFRKLCSRLHLKAETQQIDRVLEAFAHRYWECNPHCIFGSQDVVHAIVYSLLLLNTDLHVAAGDHKKMSRSAFVRNTMNAIRAQCQQREADDDMSSLTQEADPRASNVTFQSVDSNVQSLKRTASCKSSGSNGSTNHSYGVTSLDIPSSTYLHGLTSKGRSWRMEIEDVLKEMYMSVRNRQILHPMSAEERKAAANVKQGRRRSLQIRAGAFKRNVGSVMRRSGRESMAISETAAEAVFTPETSISTGAAGVQRRRSKTSLSSSLSQNSHLTQHTTTTYQAVAPLLHNPDIPNSYASGPPYYKEGLIIRKHLLERAGQKARHREWRECFMVVDRGEIRMYKLDGGISDYKRGGGGGMVRSGIMMSQISLADTFSRQNPTVVGGGDWLAYAEMVGQIDLKHTLSNTLPSGYSRQRPHAFALQQPNGGVYLFQGGSAEQVMDWVSTCNYWAARESKEPLMGGVSNLEYGWGACLEDVQEGQVYPPVQVQEWLPPMPPSVASTLEETAQLEALHRHVKELNQELDKHRDIKRKMEIRFAPRTRAMINWENKSQYLLHEIIKYQNYCDAIENSLALQVKALDEKNGDTEDT